MFSLVQHFGIENWIYLHSCFTPCLLSRTIGVPESQIPASLPSWSLGGVGHCQDGDAWRHPLHSGPFRKPTGNIAATLSAVSQSVFETPCSICFLLSPRQVHKAPNRSWVIRHRKSNISFHYKITGYFAAQSKQIFCLALPSLTNKICCKESFPSRGTTQVFHYHLAKRNQHKLKTFKWKLRLLHPVSRKDSKVYHISADH